jgi:hypothetical protein
MIGLCTVRTFGDDGYGHCLELMHIVLMTYSYLGSCPAVYTTPSTIWPSI